MTTAVNPGLQRALRRAAVAATRAVSILDTQPWRVVLRRESIEIHADRSRQLRHLDADGRGLVVSCGSALANTELSLHADGLGTRTTRLPDRRRPDLVAVVQLDSDEAPATDPLEAALLVAAVDSVRTSPTGPEVVPARFAVSSSVLAVQAPQCADVVSVVVGAVDRARSDPSALVEIAQPWFAAMDLSESAAACDERGDCGLGVVVDPSDTEQGWVRAGEVYQRLALESALEGVAVVPVLPATAYAESRSALTRALKTEAQPHVVFRSVLADQGRPARRRRLVDTLVEGA